MKKKAYISPEAEVVMIKIETLMGQFSVSSGEDDVHTDPENPVDNGDDDNHSRRRRNVWDEEEEDW